MRARLILALAALLGLSATSAHCHPGHGAPAATDLYPSSGLAAPYAASGKGIAYYNTPNRSAVPLAGKDPQAVGKVTLELKAPADVLVQFSSGLAAETGAGCPCSVRASLRVGEGPLTVIKRVNVGAPTVQTFDKYEHDRQPADGSYVFALPAGRHDISLVMHQVDGESAGLEVYYVNLQAIPFAK